jgi:type II secretory pathway pseudopilin PulG
MASFSCQTYTTGLQQSVARADETAAIAALHTIAVAQRTYAAGNDGAYGTFQQLSDAGYLDSRFNSDKPAVKDYVLNMKVTPKSEGQAEAFYSCSADPTRTDAQGRHFYIDSASSGLHVNPSGPATATDPIAQP